MAVTSNFTSAIGQANNKLYHVVEIVLDSGSRYYTDRSVSDPSGSYDYIVSDPTVSPSRIDIQRASSSFSTLSFQLLDKDAFVTADMSAETYINKTVNLYVMFDDGVLTFASDKVKVFTGSIDSLSTSQPTINFSAREVRSEMTEAIFDGQNNLNGSINDSVTTIAVDSTASFVSAGTIKIDDEYISYGSKNSTQFLSCTRATQSSTAASHSDNAEVTQVFVVSATNPITLILQVLLSIVGDGANGIFDSLKDGVGMSASDIDTDSFTTIRDAASYGNYTFVLDEVSNALAFIEDELLLPTFTRIVTSFEGKITLVEIDTSVLSPTITTIDDTKLVGPRVMNITSRSIVNDVYVKYSHSPLTDKFQAIYNDTDSVSQGQYGSPAGSSKTFSFKGMTTSAQATAFATSFLARNATPVPVINFKTFLSKRLLNPGDDIVLDTKNLTNPNDGTTNFSNIVEVLSVSQKGGEVNFQAAFTRFTSGRAGFIVPIEDISAKNGGETVLTVADGTQFIAGYYVQLLVTETGETLDQARLVTDVTGNDVTIASAFSVTVSLTTHSLTWANYSSQSSATAPSQKIWGSIIGGDGDCQDQLDGAINSSVTTITVDDTGDFPTSGYVKIDSEVISYASKNATQFLTCVRGILSTTAAAHSDNVVVKNVFDDGLGPYVIKN